MGTITRAPSGLYKARYRDLDGRSRSKSFELRRDAEDFLTNTEHKKATGAYIDPALGWIAFRAWVDEWKRGIVNLRVSTLARDYGYIDRYLLPVFGDFRIADIRHADVKAWVAQLVKEEFAPATVVKAAQIMGKIMLAAVADGRIFASPCVGIDLPTIELIEMRFLTPEEIAALAESIDRRYRALVFLGAYGGPRVGEMFALRAPGFDSLRRQVHVTETVVDVSGHLHFGPPKTRAGRRIIPLPRAVASELDRHILDYMPEDGFLFTAPKGGPVRLTNWRRRFWNPAVEKAGLGSVRPHDLRHTAVSLWIAAGATPKEIATRAGHRSVATVLDRYGHLFPGSEDRVNDALDELASSVVLASNAQIIPIRQSSKG